MEKLNGPLDVNFINRNFFPDDLGETAAINNGRCFHWAYIAFQLYKDVELWSSGVHAFVKYNNRYYDSERPMGVEHYDELPANVKRSGCGCINCRLDVQKLNVKEFTSDKWWGRSAWSFGLDWSETDDKVKKVIGNK